MSNRVNELFTPVGISQCTEVPMTTADQFRSNNHSAIPTMQGGNFADLPEELVVEIMRWCMRSDESESSARSFGSTCSRFSHLLGAHLAGDWYKQFRSEAMHQRANEFVKSFVSEVWGRYKHNPAALPQGQLKPSDLENLASKLHWLDKDGPLRTYLSLEKLNRSGKNWLQAFREYEGTSLPLECGAIKPEMVALVEQLERALPPHVCLHLKMAGYGDQEWERDFPNFIANICSRGRMLALEIYCYDLLLPATKTALLSALCGKSFAPVVYLEFSNSQRVLNELKDHCNDFRHVKLLILDISARHGNTIDIPALTEFMQALAERKRNGHSSISVVLINKYSKEVLGFPQDTFDENPVISEDLRIFFGVGDQLLRREGWMQKVSATVGEGAIDTWDPASVTKLILPDSISTDDFSDSDLFGEVADGEGINNVSFEREQALVQEPVQARTPELPRRSIDSDSIVEDSDSIVESGDEASFAHSSFDESEKPAPVSHRVKAQRPKRKSNDVEVQRPTQNRRPDTSTQSEPKIKKRDKCVIS